MQHRLTIQDAAFAIGIILLAGFGAFEFSFTGSVQAERRIEFEEMLILGAVIVVSILYLGWRRVRDQQREIGRRIAAERRAHELAHTDPLTGLANRRELETAVRASVAAPPGAEEVHAVLTMDLNGFKKVNDIYRSSRAGDEVLMAVAQRSAQGDARARPGGAPRW